MFYHVFLQIHVDHLRQAVGLHKIEVWPKETTCASVLQLAQYIFGPLPLRLSTIAATLDMCRSTILKHCIAFKHGLPLLVSLDILMSVDR